MRRFLRRVFRHFVPLPVPPAEPETLALLVAVLRPDSNVVDAGCNRGSILREIVRLAPHGTHHAFEPNPQLCRVLRRSYPRVGVHQLALSDRVGTASFQLFTAFDGFSGFHRREDSQGADVETITVETARLDDLLPPDRHVDLIKIDVEGAEHLVMSGALGILKRCRPVVVFECGKGGLDLYGIAPGAIVDLLAGTGHTVRPLVGWPDAPAVSREEFERMFAEGTHYMWVAEPG